MRRIVVIAAGPAGLSAATRIKRRLSEHEVNVILPASVARPDSAAGPAGRRYAAGLPNLELAASREIGILEADDVMPDLAEQEITVSSSRGKLPVRYTELVVEVPALVRVPRVLRKAGNVFSWPQPDFGADPAACDAALCAAADSGLPVLVAGNGAEALEAVFLAAEAGAKCLWIRTGEGNLPGLDPLLTARALLPLCRAGSVECVDLPDAAADRLEYLLTADGSSVTGIRLPAPAAGETAREAAVACLMLTAPLLAGHPLLREEGVELDPQGRISLRGDAPGLFLMGSGAVVPAAKQSFSGLEFPSWPGGRETAELSAWLTVNALAETAADGKFPGALGIRGAVTSGLRFFRAGFCQGQAAAQGLETEYAVVALTGAADSSLALSPERFAEKPADRGADADGTAKSAAGTTHNANAGAGAPPCRPEAMLALSLLCERHSRTIIGVQVLGCGERADEADALFGMATAALAEGTPIDALAWRGAFTGAARLPGLGAGILCNKLDTIVMGITPDEFLASRAAGAEFFTLDLRSLPEWRAGHVPGAYSIPLPQLKKRLQDEVPRFTPIVLVSADGRDAYAVACRLAGLGATDLYVLDGGMQLWPHALEKE